MNSRLIATTQKMKNFSRNVTVPIYANEYWARSRAGRELHKEYDEQDRTDLMHYLYSRLHINPKYWMYEYDHQKNQWILLEEIELTKEPRP